MHSPLEIRNSGNDLNSNSKLSKQIYIFDIILSLKGYRMRSRSCCCFTSSLCLSLPIPLQSDLEAVKELN